MLPKQAVDQSVQTSEFNTEKDAYAIGQEPFFWGYIQHHEILAPWGSRQRDVELRKRSYAVHNSLFQSAVASFIKRIQAVPYEIKGGRNNVRYYQDMLSESDFGNGWESLVGKFLWDFFTQDFGGIFEIIGKGRADKPITGRVTGLSVLDSLSCQATRSYAFPLVYWNEEDGSFHRMHISRATRLADMASPVRRAYNNGFCALSRYYSESTVDILLNRYDIEALSDMPPPGILAVSGMTQVQWQQASRLYQADRVKDGEGVFRQTMVVHAIDPQTPVKLEIVPFSQEPVNFDAEKYVRIHVNKLALALGVDPQDIWPLTGSALGTGAQSVILNEKGKGKSFGYILQLLTRFMNWNVLSKDCEFQFKFKDSDGDKQKAEQAQIWAGIAVQLKSTGLMTTEQSIELLANNVQEFGNVYMDEAGQLVLPSDDPKEVNDGEQLTAGDETPLDSEAPQEPETTSDPDTPPSNVPGQGRGTGYDGAANRAIQGRPELDGVLRHGDAVSVKAFGDTRDDYVRNVEIVLADAANGDVTRATFGVRMRSLLNTYGKAAYIDGLNAGGVETDTLDSEDADSVAGLLAANSGWVTDAGAKIFGADGVFIGTPEGRATQWGNKSLQEFYDHGVMSADKNGLYMWKYGDTEHCDDCQRLNGQKHRYKDWFGHIMPKSSALKCKGFNCACELVKTTGRTQGSY